MTDGLWARAISGLVNWPGKGSPIVLTTTLSINECKAELRKVIRPALLRRSDQWAGYLRDDGFAVWPPGMGRLSGTVIAHRLVGRISPSPEGTRIDARIELHPVSRVVVASMVMFLGFSILFLVGALAAHLFHVVSPSALRQWGVFGVLVTLLICCYEGWTGAQSVDDGPELLALVTHVLHADASPQGVP